MVSNSNQAVSSDLQNGQLQPAVCSISIECETLQQEEKVLARRLTAEAGRLTKLSVPLLIQNLLGFSTTVIAVAIVGNLDRPDLLSSAVLANSLFNVTGFSIMQGLASGMESLCAQAYGARSYKTLGLVLQRALLMCWVVCIPISLLWAYSEQVLLRLGQQPSIAAGAARYLRIIMPALYTGAVVECVKRYLLAQRVVLPGMLIMIVTCLLSPFYNWLFVFRLQLELQGAATAFACSQGTTAFLLVLYTIVRDVRMASRGAKNATWCRPNMTMFSGWVGYLRYGLPATIQLCTESWMYEVFIFMAGVGYNAETAQGALGLLFLLSELVYMSGLAYGSSANTRVGNELGAGNRAAARLSVYTCAVIVALVHSLITVACRLAGKQIVRVLTNNEEVHRVAVDAIPIMLPTFVLDALNPVAQGVLRGAGRPGIGAVLNTVAYWGLALPLAWYFGLRLDWSVQGALAALLITSGLMVAVHSVVVTRLCWAHDLEVQRAAKRMAKHEATGAEDWTVSGVPPVLIRTVSSSYEETDSPEPSSTQAGKRATFGMRQGFGDVDDLKDITPLADVGQAYRPTVGAARKDVEHGAPDVTVGA